MKKAENDNYIDTVASWKPMLLARPVRNIAARVEKTESGLVRIHLKRKKPRYFVPPLSWIIPLRPEQILKLDRIGSQIWGLCDGKRSVEAVVEHFAQQYRLTFHEGRVMVTDYLKTLIQRGALAIAMQKESGDER